MNVVGEVLQVIIVCIAALGGIAFWVGAIIAIWMLILGKFQRPTICPKCGADLRAPGRRQPFSTAQ